MCDVAEEGAALLWVISHAAEGFPADDAATLAKDLLKVGVGGKLVSQQQTLQSLGDQTLQLFVCFGPVGFSCVLQHRALKCCRDLSFNPDRVSLAALGPGAALYLWLVQALLAFNLPAAAAAAHVAALHRLTATHSEADGEEAPAAGGWPLVYQLLFS